MRFERRFTKDGQAAYANIEFRHATSEIRNPDGTIVFRAENIEVPTQFSQVATDILAQKYFRKAGVPTALKPVEENAVPSGLRISLVACLNSIFAYAAWPFFVNRLSKRIYLTSFFVL